MPCIGMGKKGKLYNAFQMLFSRVPLLPGCPHSFSALSLFNVLLLWIGLLYITPIEFRMWHTMLTFPFLGLPAEHYNVWSVVRFFFLNNWWTHWFSEIVRLFFIIMLAYLFLSVLLSYRKSNLMFVSVSDTSSHPPPWLHSLLRWQNSW